MYPAFDFIVRPPKSATARRSVVLAIALFMAAPVVTLSLAGCGNAPLTANNVKITTGQTERPSVAGIRLILGFDASAGVRPRLGQYAALGSQLAGNLDEGTDALTLVRVDRQTTAFSDRPATGSARPHPP